MNIEELAEYLQKNYPAGAEVYIGSEGQTRITGQHIPLLHEANGKPFVRIVEQIPQG